MIGFAALHLLGSIPGFFILLMLELKAELKPANREKYLEDLDKYSGKHIYGPQKDPDLIAQVKEPSSLVFSNTWCPRSGLGNGPCAYKTV